MASNGVMRLGTQQFPLIAKKIGAAALFFGLAIGTVQAKEVTSATVGGSHDAVPAVGTLGAENGEFRSLFQNWKKLDPVSRVSVSIPSRKPIDTNHLVLSSQFGTRSDPFTGHARSHEGIDIPGPMGTPIYATADGVVEIAGRVNGYGNFIELDHGNGIETRYGHMSKLLVSSHQRVKRGEMIGLMGSTGRSTGSHLHYEVRIKGHPVSPMTFVNGGDYLLAMRQQNVQAMDTDKPDQLAMGGPASQVDTE